KALVFSIVLLLEPCLSLACLQCDPDFASHFSSYAPKLSRKSWGLGVVPVAGRRLRGWVQDTLQELNLKISPEIRELSPKQGDLPKKLDSIFEEQIQMLQDAIIDSELSLFSADTKLVHCDGLLVICLAHPPTQALGCPLFPAFSTSAALRGTAEVEKAGKKRLFKCCAPARSICQLSRRHS
uniref:Uncharacterized protein n=1 Tax=Pseudonaja textilis TaxID=8673 RepID=A0A670XS87_PSETE